MIAAAAGGAATSSGLGAGAAKPGKVQPMPAPDIGGWWERQCLKGKVAWILYNSIGQAIKSEPTSKECGEGEECTENGEVTWPDTPEEMDELLGIEGESIPDGPTTPGRDKKVWKPNDNTTITHEQHPYHPDAPDWHKGPHWHLDTPRKKHERFKPGDLAR